MLRPEILVPASLSIREVLARIDASSTQMALVIDGDRKLLGTVTDGDVRRGLLSGLGLDDPIATCMHTEPTVVAETISLSDTVALMRRLGLRHVPVIDAVGRIIDLRILEDLLSVPKRDNLVVLMVGGLGSRLEELTKDTPKPMLKVGGKPLLEHIVDNFKSHGFHRFKLAVNYKAAAIENHFGDGSALGCEIGYLRESQRMGTAGALSLLKAVPEHPILVSNGDLLARLNLANFLDHHIAIEADATMAVRNYEVQIPYGVAHTSDGKLLRFEEKPIHRHLVCTGLYVLSPSTLQHVPEDCFFDMPTLFEKVAKVTGRAHVYRFDGYWLDVGRKSDYERALAEFSTVSHMKSH